MEAYQREVEAYERQLGAWEACAKGRSMLARGVPRQAVMLQMGAEGLDTSLLDAPRPVAPPEPEPLRQSQVDRDAAAARAAAAREQPRWVPSTETSVCMLCAKGLSKVLNPRHHCRRCGWAVCGRCSTNTAILDRWLLPDKPHAVRETRSPEPLRVCDLCAAASTAEEPEAPPDPQVLPEQSSAPEPEPGPAPLVAIQAASLRGEAGPGGVKQSALIADLAGKLNLHNPTGALGLPPAGAATCPSGGAQAPLPAAGAEVAAAPLTHATIGRAKRTKAAPTRRGRSRPSKLTTAAAVASTPEPEPVHLAASHVQDAVTNTEQKEYIALAATTAVAAAHEAEHGAEQQRHRSAMAKEAAAEAVATAQVIESDVEAELGRGCTRSSTTSQPEPRPEAEPEPTPPLATRRTVQALCRGTATTVMTTVVTVKRADGSTATTTTTTTVVTK
jgi:hypothetical protein